MKQPNGEYERSILLIKSYAPSEEWLQNWAHRSPSVGWVLSYLCASVVCFSLNIKWEEKKTKGPLIQAGAQMLWDDNGDGENGHGE